MRRLCIAAVLAAVLAGGAIAAPGDPEQWRPNAADQARAQHGNLTLRDLPSGFVSRPLDSTDWSTFTCSAFAPDLSAFTITGEASSLEFGTTTTLLASETKVFRSSHDALADWRLSVRRGAVKCLVLFVLSGAATPNDRVTSSAMLSPPLGVRSAAFRIGAKTSLNGRPVRVWFDVLATTRGRARATLAVWGLRTPAAAAFEHALLMKLAARLSH